MRDRWGRSVFTNQLESIERKSQGNEAELRVRDGFTEGAFAGADITAASTGGKGGNSTHGGCAYLTIDFYDVSVPEIHMFLAEDRQKAKDRIKEMLKRSDRGLFDPPKGLAIGGPHTIGQDGCLAFVMCGDCEPLDLAYILEEAAKQLRKAYFAGAKK